MSHTRAYLHYRVTYISRVCPDILDAPVDELHTVLEFYRDPESKVSVHDAARALVEHHHYTTFGTNWILVEVQTPVLTYQPEHPNHVSSHHRM